MKIRGAASVLAGLFASSLFAQTAPPAPASLSPTAGTIPDALPVFYVSGDGNDANPGSSERPYRTITRALQDSGTNPTIFVQPGRYDAAAGEVFPITLPSGADLMSTGGPAVTIVDAGGAARVFRLSGNNAETLLQGLTITGGFVSAPAGGNAAGGGILSENGDRTVIRWNVIRDNEVRGETGAPGGTASGGGIHIDRSSPQIMSNLIRNNIARGGDGAQRGDHGGGGFGGAISTSGAAATLLYNTIVANLAAGGNGGGSPAAEEDGGAGAGGALHEAAGISLRNNILAYNVARGGSAAGGAVDGTPANETRNIEFANTPADIRPLSLAVDPLFVSPALHNYRIRAGSPARAGADPTGAPFPTLDLDGHHRRWPRLAIGAYEDARTTFPADFGAGHRTTVSIFRPSTGTWYLRPWMGEPSGYDIHEVPTTAAPNEIPVPADYRGFDISAAASSFRPGGGTWSIRYVHRLVFADVIRDWGMDPADRPVPADYDGDGRADAAVFRQGQGHWLIRRSSNNTLLYIPSWGVGPNDTPVPGDYDGDGVADAAVFRPGEGHWYIRRSSDATMLLIPHWGMGPNDVPVPADYDGDARIDAAVFRPGTGEWFIRQSSDSALFYVPSFGPLPGDVPVPGDYDGDGRADVAIFRPGGDWFIRSSIDGTMSIVPNFGPEPGDLPVPAYAH